MEGEGQGAGNGGSRHRQQMGLETLGEQAVALTHAETVLFIHHHQAQPIELDRVLQQGMGAHKQLELAVGEILQQAPALASRGRAGEQVEAHMELGEPKGQSLQVLLRQHLGGSHQGPLPAGLHRP